MKRNKPKKLNIHEMWSAYLLIESGIRLSQEKYLLHELIKIMENIDVHNFKRFLSMFFGIEFYVNKNPGDFALMFVESMKQSNMFIFSDFIKSLNNDNSS